MSIQSMYEQILKTGVTKYRTLHSKASLPAQVQAARDEKAHKKGGIFAVRHKGHFLNGMVKGFVLTSVEALFDNRPGITHWTPNVFREYTYTDDTKTYVKGYSEENLLQVNTFVVDIDTKKHTVNDILLSCMDNSVGLPTLIVASDRGYHVYFVLDKPIYISNAHNFRSLTVAKTIANNIKRSLQDIDADLYCNDFGFFRLPTESNIVFYQSEMVYEASQLINWSMQKSDDRNENPFRVFHNTQNVSTVMESDWFQALIHATSVKGQRGKLGRNNLMFTLALICLQDGYSIERTEDFLDTFNTSLELPLKHKEVVQIVRSAFSGKYKGAAIEYVQTFLELYVPGHSFDVKLGKKTWYKFKKARPNRERSHYDEWENDLINYLTAESSNSEPFIWRTQKEICKAINIPSSTLNEVIKQSSTILRTVTGRGSAKKTGWTTLDLFKKHVLYSLQMMKKAYSHYLTDLMATDLTNVESTPACVMARTFIQSILQRNDLRPIDISVVNTS